MEEAEERESRLEQLLEGSDERELVSYVSGLHPADIAAVFAEVSLDARRTLVDALDHEGLADLISYLPPVEVSSVLAHVALKDHGSIVAELSDDDLVDILQAMDEDERNRMFRLLPDSKKRIARTLLHYPEDSAGGRMTTALAIIHPEMTIREAIESLRERSEQTEVLSRIFVADDTGRLVGKVRLRDLTFNRRSLHVRDVMEPDTIAVRATDDQEEAVRLMSKYDLFALPVVDDTRRLVGVITSDDALEIQEEESTEDLERQSAISGPPEDIGYLETPVMRHLSRRFGWVLGLALLAIVSGVVIYEYEPLLNQIFVLAIYMPMVVAAGGNTGGQAATMVIRAMSLGEFEPSAVMRVAWKEARIGLLIGSLLGTLIGALLCWVTPVIALALGKSLVLPENTSIAGIAFAVGISLAAQITTSTLVGSILPILAKSLRLDPAVVASPAITTIVDVTGLIIYFALAKWILAI